MEISEILHELERNRGYFPEAAVREAIARREEITPDLLRILEETIANAEALAKEGDYFAHIYAMYLLAQFREIAAYPLSIGYGRLSEKLHERLSGDLITEGYCRILASVCGGDLGPIKELVQDPTVFDRSRGAGLRALNVLAKAGHASRDELIEYYRTLFHGGLERQYAPVWTNLVYCATELHPGELMDEILHVYEEDLVDRFAITWDEVQAEASRERDKAMVRTIQDEGGLIDDVPAVMIWWACFKPKLAPNPSPKAVASAKIGRNDRCPCGSGKKYKKCCGKGK